MGINSMTLIGADRGVRATGSTGAYAHALAKALDPAAVTQASTTAAHLDRHVSLARRRCIHKWRRRWEIRGAELLKRTRGIRRSTFLLRQREWRDVRGLQLHPLLV